jgi:hypothetical protein
MGPVDVFFFILVALWGVIGLVRGYHRELGVTLLLFVGLFVPVFLDARYSTQMAELMGFIVGPDPCKQIILKNVLYCVFLIFIAFISYQGEVFRYPGTTSNSFISWLVGLLNGYLLVGSVWYYLAQAQWPLNLVKPPFSVLYDAIYTILPPAIFKWPVILAVILIMVILRVIR